MDQSKLDQKYFIDKYVYNCPFCKRGNVSYYINGGIEFDWTNFGEVYISTIILNYYSNSNKYELYKSILYFFTAYYIII